MRCELKTLTPANLTLRKLLSELDFVCNNAENGCRKIIPYDKVNKHLETCEYAMIQCPASTGCKKNGLRPLMEKHISQCEHVHI
jgi:hypothetical protein